MNNKKGITPEILQRMFEEFGKNVAVSVTASVF